MKVQETLSFSFYSSQLNKNKYEEFFNKALAIKEFKNSMSLEIASNLEKYLNYTKFQMVKEFGTKYNCLYTSPLIRGNEYQKAVVDVFDSYQNKFEAVLRKIRFHVQKGITIKYYKKKTTTNGKIKEKDDLKEFKIEKTETKLCKVLDYLAKFWNEGLVEYLNSLESKHQLQEDVLAYLNKYGQRLVNLALLRKENIIYNYSSPIVFKALTYRSALQAKGSLLIKDKNKTNLIGLYHNMSVCKITEL